MANLVERLKQTFSPFHGRQFKGMEELENAVFPLFGPLQPHFGGEGFRDLIDKLINVGWIKKNATADTYTFDIPGTEASKPVQTIQGTATVTAQPQQLSFREIYLLVELNQREVDVDFAPISIFQSLIDKGLVEIVNRQPELDPQTRSLLEADIQNAKTAAVNAIMIGEVGKAIDFCYEIVEAEDELNRKYEVICLSAAGKQFMAAQPDATIGIQ